MTPTRQTCRSRILQDPEYKKPRCGISSNKQKKQEENSLNWLQLQCRSQWHLWTKKVNKYDDRPKTQRTIQKHILRSCVEPFFGPKNIQVIHERYSDSASLHLHKMQYVPLSKNNKSIKKIHTEIYQRKKNNHKKYQSKNQS